MERHGLPKVKIKEYYPHVYLINDESPEGIAKVLCEICRKDIKERQKRRVR